VETQQLVILILGFVLLSVLMFWPQWQARRRRQKQMAELHVGDEIMTCLLYTSPSPRDRTRSRMPSSA